SWWCLYTLQWNLSLSRIDKSDARPGMRVAVVNFAKTTATPGKVHLAHQKPVTVRRHCHHLRPMTRRARPLHVRREEDRRAGHRLAPPRIPHVLGDVGVRQVSLAHPPVAVAKTWTEGIRRGVGGVDRGVTVRRHRPLGDLWHEPVAVLAELA